MRWKFRREEGDRGAAGVPLESRVRAWGATVVLSTRKDPSAVRLRRPHGLTVRVPSVTQRMYYPSYLPPVPTSLPTTLPCGLTAVVHTLHLYIPGCLRVSGLEVGLLPTKKDRRTCPPGLGQDRGLDEVGVRA